MIDTSTFNKFENIADQIDSYLENLRSLNVNKDLSVSDYLKKRDVKIKQLSDWTDAIHRISFSNKEANTSIFAAEKLFIEQYYGWEGLYDEQITNEIKKKIQNLIAKVESLEFPIIGKVFTDIDYLCPHL
jgi:hypothetical protein